MTNNEQSIYVPDITIDLGNSSYKMLVDDKRVIHSSNVQEVPEGTFGAVKVDLKHFIIGANAKSKKNTNKICDEKRALLGYALYSVIPDKAKLNITTLLPLSLYVKNENKQKYANLLKGRYTVSNADGAQKTFTIGKVEVCAESFSSLVTNEKLMKEPLYLVDIGGVDASAVYVNRTPDVNSSFTYEKGMNVFFAELGRKLTSELLESYDEKDAKLFFEKYESLSDEHKKIVDDFAEQYVKDNVFTPLKEIGYKSIIHKLVFVGGGSEALKKYLLKEAGATVLEDAIWSNVKGAKILAIRRGKKNNAN